MKTCGLSCADDGGAGVLAHGQHAAGGDVGVLQQVIGDELVVRGRLRVVEDGAELFQMRRPQQVVDVGEGGFRERPQALALDHQHVAAHDFFGADPADIELAVLCLIRPEREQGRVGVGRKG